MDEDIMVQKVRKFLYGDTPLEDKRAFIASALHMWKFPTNPLPTKTLPDHQEEIKWVAANLTFFFLDTLKVFGNANDLLNSTYAFHVYMRAEETSLAKSIHKHFTECGVEIWTERYRNSINPNTNK